MQHPTESPWKDFAIQVDVILGAKRAQSTTEEKENGE